MVNYLLNPSKYLKYAAKHVLIYLFIKQLLTKKNSHFLSSLRLFEAKFARDFFGRKKRKSLLWQ